MRDATTSRAIALEVLAVAAPRPITPGASPGRRHARRAVRRDWLHCLERCRLFAPRAILCLSDALERRIAWWRYGIAHELQHRRAEERSGRCDHRASRELPRQSGHCRAPG